MAKRLLTIVLTTFALFVGQQIFSGCETASADDPEYSGTVNNSGEDSSNDGSSDNQNNTDNSTDNSTDDSTDDSTGNSTSNSTRNSTSNSTGNTTGNTNRQTTSKTLAWKNTPPSILYKGEIQTFTVINNTGSVVWSVTPSGAATISSTASNGTSAIIKAANPTDATSIKVTATDQSTKKSISAEIPLANPL